jgi:O-acetyl-ADP-ribose deacetylase
VFRIAGLTLDIIEGDLAAQHADALVNAANAALWMGGGVAGALKRSGGREIEHDAMRQGPIEPGGAVITGAGRLAARHVIHAAVMAEDLRTDAGLIRRATAAALDLADAEGLVSIAFPALGTGVGGFPLDECARVMFEVIRERAAGLTSVAAVTMVLYGDAARLVFDRVATQMFNAPD